VKLPNPHRAVADLAKLRDYCLNPHHPRGRHKARVFASKLGLAFSDAEDIRAKLMEAARRSDCVSGGEDEHGWRYVIDLAMTGPAGRARVRSAWIVRRGEDLPRFVSCYVL
jgi:hypothetical protein